MSDFLEQLQNKPYATRIKILWGATATIGLVVLVIWVVSLRGTIKNTQGNGLLNPTSGTQQSQAESKFVTVERIENTGTNLKIYFNFDNQTDDILNISNLDDITLAIGSEETHPASIVDRQGQTFAKKILSHTQIFGTLTFLKTDQPTATLLFEKMFLEKAPDQSLQQTIELDFNKLKSDSKLRN